MSHLSRYKEFLKILERWPLDSSKTGRDLGERLRHCVKNAFNAEQQSIGDPKECDRQYKSLKIICDNHYNTLYKRSKPYTSTGLTLDECRLLLKNESLEILKNEDGGFFARIKLK